jgi:exonuclease I
MLQDIIGYTKNRKAACEWLELSDKGLQRLLNAKSPRCFPDTLSRIEMTHYELFKEDKRGQEKEEAKAHPEAQAQAPARAWLLSVLMKEELSSIDDIKQIRRMLESLCHAFGIE